MEQIKKHAPEENPPAIATEGKGAYQTWGTLPEYSRAGRPPTAKKPGKEWKYLQVVKKREGSK
jgi:hypothetical protein